MEKTIYQTVEIDNGVEYIHEHYKEEEAIQHAKNLEQSAYDLGLTEEEYSVYAFRVTIDSLGVEEKHLIWDNRQ